MHPNWRALATLHIPLKRFVTEGAECEEPSTSSYKQKYQVSNVSASEVKEFYEEVLKTPTSAAKVQIPQPKQNLPKETRQISFDKNKFFRAAMANNVDLICSIQFNGNEINSTDVYGWTALMMAACEGSADAVEALLLMGADPDHKDRSGNTAMSLASKKNFYNIVQLLSKREEEVSDTNCEEQDQDVVHSEFYCDVCTRKFQETSLRNHVTSTVHQFNLKRDNRTPINRFTIRPNDRGLKIMLKQGWDKSSGLGPSNSGRLFPVKTVIRKQRTGLGTKQDPARVTHFGEYDLRAIKYVARPRTRNRNDIRHEKHREWKRERRLRRELE